jgi:TP901 family phage tail tape measure protein
VVAKTDLLVQIRASDRATPSIKNLQSTIIRFVGAVSAAIAGLSAVAFPVKQAAEFEKELRAVQKTTGFLDEDIRRLGDSLSNLSTELVTPATDLAQIAAVAGQLGLGSTGRAGIERFTREVAIASTALDITAESAATAGARLGNIFNLDVSQTRNIFASINELSNTTTANAEQLVDVLQRIGSTAGLAFEESAALAATAIDLGVSQEVAGTSIAKVFSRLSSESEKFAEALGVDIGEFIGLGALERFQLFISTLAGQSEQLRAQNIRELAGGGRIFVTIDKFVNDAARGGLELAKNLRTANLSFEEGTSAVTEYETQTNTLLAALQLLGNSFTKLSRDVGTTLLTRLADLARELADFFNSEDAREFGRIIADEFEGIIDFIENGVRAFGELDINLQNVIATVKVFIALGMVKVLRSIIISTAAWNAQLLITIGRFTGINRLLVAFGVASASSLGVTAFNFRNLIARVSGFAVALFRLIPVVGIILGVGTLLVKGLEAAGVEFDALFQSVANFFGFVSSEQAKQQRARAKELRDLREEIDKNEALISEAQSALSDDRFGTRGQVIPIRLDVEGGADEFNKQLDQSVQGLGTLEAAEQAVGTRITQNKERQAEVSDEIGNQLALLRELREEEINALRVERGVGGSIFGDADFDETRSFEEINAQIQKVRVSLTQARAEQERLAQAITDQTVIQEDLQDETDKLARKFAESFDLATNRALQLRAQLELTTDDIAEKTAKLKDDQEDLQQLLDQGPSGASSAAAAKINDQVDKLEASIDKQLNAIQELRNTQKKQQTEFNTAVANAAENTKTILETAEPGIRTLSEEGLQGLVNGLGQAQKIVTETAGSFVDLDKKAEALGLELASFDAKKAGLLEAKEAAEDLAKTAKGAFDNTNKTIRAFRKNVLDTVRDIRTELGNRIFELRASVRLDELDDETKDLQEKRAQVEEAGQKRIDDARLNTEKAYLKRRLDENLEAIDREIAAVEVRRGFLEEQALRGRIDRLKARSDEFIRLAQDAAQAGDVDKALGLTAAARDATKEIGNVISELTKLETVTAQGDRIFQLREGEILNLISDLQQQERRVTQALPGINRTLAETTDAEVKKIQAVLDEVEAGLRKFTNELNKTANLLGDRGAEFRQAVQSSRERNAAALDRTGATSGRISAADIASGREGLVLARKRIEQESEAIDEQKKLIIEMKKLTAAVSTSGARAVFDVDEKAEGGLIRGPGTTKSDSILAKLSRGEFVVNAETTRRFGPGFFAGLQALARRGKNLPGFATGGLGLPSFEPVIQAAGTGGAPVHVHLPGGETMRLREGEDDTLTVKRIAKREALKRGTRAR